MQFERIEMYKAKVVVMYKGTNKIYAIKALRDVFGIGLKEAQDSVEHSYGIEMYYNDYDSVRRCYKQTLEGNDMRPVCRWVIHSENKPIDLVR